MAKITSEYRESNEFNALEILNALQQSKQMQLLVDRYRNSRQGGIISDVKVSPETDFHNALFWAMRDDDGNPDIIERICTETGLNRPILEEWLKRK